MLIDQIGQFVQLKTWPPKRLVSLVPSQTELLYALGLEEEVIGITKFCIKPKTWFEQKTRIGGTKNPKLALIQSLQPDLILANKEENRQEDVLALAQNYPVYTSDVANLGQALAMIRDFGLILDRVGQAQSLIQNIETGFAELQGLNIKQRVLYLIWQNPFMSIGSDTFIHAMLEQMGLENCLKDQQRYPQLSLEDIKALQPDLVFLSSEPFPFGEAHRLDLAGILGSGTRVICVDGEAFSWYGSRLLESPRIFRELIKEIKPA